MDAGTAGAVPGPGWRSVHRHKHGSDARLATGAVSLPRDRKGIHAFFIQAWVRRMLHWPHILKRSAA